MLQNSTVISIFFVITESKYVDKGRSEKLATNFFIRFHAFFMMLLNLISQDFFVVYYLNYWSLKRFLVNNLDKKKFLEVPQEVTGGAL